MKRNLLRKEEDSDPMSVVSNLFDVAMVFAVALMVALVTRYNMTEMFSQEDFTMVKNPGKENMEIITKEGQKINREFGRLSGRYIMYGKGSRLPQATGRGFFYP